MSPLSAGATRPDRPSVSGRVLPVAQVNLLVRRTLGPGICPEYCVAASTDKQIYFARRQHSARNMTACPAEFAPADNGDIGAVIEVGFNVVQA